MIAPVRHHPIVLQLVRANPFEALILNELERRPAARQDEWLRSLLVQGFQCECRALQMVEAAGDTMIEAQVINDTPAPRPALTVANDAPVSAPPARPSAEESDCVEAPMTFAALRKVIG